MWCEQSGPHINPDLIRDYTDAYLRPIRKGGAMKFVDFCRMVGAGREYGESHLVRSGVAIHWVGNTRVVDRNEVAAWLSGHNGRAWLDGRLQRGKLTAEQYNAVVDFRREYGG